MASLLARLAALFGVGPRPQTRLSGDQAVEIALAHLKIEAQDRPGFALYPYEVRDVDGRLVWTLRSNTKGSWMIVTVDDATGAVLDHKVHGIR